MILKFFLPEVKAAEITVFGNGHINDTFKVCTEKEEYILQRINSAVFKHPEQVVDNHQRVQSFFVDGLSAVGIPKLINDPEGRFLLKDKQGGFWRIMNFIKDSYSIDCVNENWQALEAGIGFSYFAKVCANLNVNDFVETIPDFHNLSCRQNQLNAALEKDCCGRKSGLIEIIDFYRGVENSLHDLKLKLESGELPRRLVHNDTKINNLLFRDKRVVAVIDLDTLGPGTILYDYGDALRTISNEAEEDEPDLSLVRFNLGYFKAFSDAYLTQLKDVLLPVEKKHLHLAPVLMTYIMGIRFLTDYLNGDVYYKVDYAEHNLVRSKVQQKHLQNILASMDQIKSMIDLSFK